MHDWRVSDVARVGMIRNYHLVIRQSVKCHYDIGMLVNGRFTIRTLRADPHWRASGRWPVTDKPIGEVVTTLVIPCSSLGRVAKIMAHAHRAPRRRQSVFTVYCLAFDESRRLSDLESVHDFTCSCHKRDVFVAILLVFRSVNARFRFRSFFRTPFRSYFRKYL